MQCGCHQQVYPIVGHEHTKGPPVATAIEPFGLIFSTYMVGRWKLGPDTLQATGSCKSAIRCRVER